MGRFFAVLISIILWSANAFAQDTLVMRNGDEILAKVEEVGVYEIKYHKADNLTGPVYVALRANVFMIKYANGTHEVFSSAEAPAETDLPVPQPRENERRDPRAERERRERQDRGRLRPSYDYVRLNEMGSKRIVAGAVITTLGGAFLISGITLTATEMRNSFSNNPNRTNPERLIAGTFLTIAGIPCTIIGPILLGKGFRYRRMAAEQGPSLSFSPVINNPGLLRYGNHYNQTQVGTISLTF
jgi:hypothetical protein